MSRFKFRVWDEVGKRMIYSIAVYDGGDHVGFNEENNPDVDWQQSNVGTGDEWLYLLDSFVLMQFTGLEDMNGKPIYEGDILSDKDEWWPELVVWKTYRFAIRTIFDMDISPNLVKNMYVAGNVYENPELLGGQNDSHYQTT